MARRVLPITSVARLEALTPKQRQTYGERVRFAGRLFEGGRKPARAAREAGTTLRTMERYGVVRRRGGRWRSTLGRTVYDSWLPTTSGPRRLTIATAAERRLDREYRDAFRRWVRSHGQDDSALAKQGRSIGGFTLETDPAVLGEMLDRGELDPREVGSGETAR
jgi:hypothetical protein